MNGWITLINLLSERIIRLIILVVKKYIFKQEINILDFFSKLNTNKQNINTVLLQYFNTEYFLYIFIIVTNISESVVKIFHIFNKNHLSKFFYFNFMII